MGNYYQGQRYETADGNMLVYDVKKGWQAVDQQSSQNYKTGLKDVQLQKDSYNRIKVQEPLLAQANGMLSNKSFLGIFTDMNNGKVKTGGLYNQDGEKNRSWAPALSKDADRFATVSKQIQASISPPPGQGAVSDYERSLFSAESPGLDKFVDTNRASIARRQALITEQRDYANFLDDYLRRKGTTDGAPLAWQQYVAADPYLGPSSKDPSRTVAYTKEPERWDQYINKGFRPVPRGTMTEGMAPKQIETRAQFKGAQGQVGTRANPYVPRTRKEYEGLPHGAVYIASNGQIAVRNRNAGTAPARQPPRKSQPAPQGATKLRYNPQTGDFE